MVKRNKNQLRDYMTTGPAHTEAAPLTGPARLMQSGPKSKRDTIQNSEKLINVRKSHLSYCSHFTTVFLDSRLWKTKQSRKRLQNFRQSCVLSTDRIEIHQSQPLV